MSIFFKSPSLFKMQVMKFSPFESFLLTRFISKPCDIFLVVSFLSQAGRSLVDDGRPSLVIIDYI